jgi:glycosyltransferase involved in cell wall biosynthesis
VPADDVPALAEAVAELLDDPRRGRELGLRGRARAERLFDLRRNVARLAALFGAKPERPEDER